MKKILIISALLYGTTLLKAQSGDVLLDFNVKRHQDDILINWVIAAGNQCQGVKVEHSTDSVDFVAIYEFPGICGSSGSNEKYSFLHTTPGENKRNYYRLNLGVQGQLNIIGIDYIKLSDKGYALFPMPVTYNSKIYFNNDNNETVSLTVFNASGAIVTKMENIKSNEISLNQFVLPKGRYYFTIQGNLSSIRGDFVIVTK